MLVLHGRKNMVAFYLEAANFLRNIIIIIIFI